ncbi:type I restriction-modification system, M subunit [Leptolyngbya sp. NIES-3755]|nr:type I restriction-modification system, M subunit [Leptolyngbya sp. NIES-3755]
MQSLESSYSLSQLQQHLWDAANLLRGPIDAADFKSYIFPLLFFKRICDVYDEEYQQIQETYGEEFAAFPENHRFQVPEGHHWRNVFERDEQIGFALQTALRELEKANPDALYGIFGDAQWANTERLPDSLMKKLLEHFNQIRLANAHVREDMMGQAYEYLIKKFADSSNKKAGEFYTPRTIVRLMVNILDPRSKESIYDPACGTGGMLLEAIHHVRESQGEWRNLVIRGQERNLTTQGIARMNLFLHGVEDFKVVRGDTLQEPAFHVGDALEQFDCVLANPPFSLKKWGRDQWISDVYARNVFGLPGDSNGDFAWVMHMMKSLKPGKGRMAVVLPHGVLFRGGKEGEIRKRLLIEDYIEAIIGLGSNLFYGTGIPGCILVMRDRKAVSDREKVFFIDASEIYTKGRSQNTLTPEQSDQIYAICRDRQEITGISRSVELQEIESHGYNLNISRYIQKEQVEQGMSVQEAIAQLQESLKLQAQAEERLEALLKKAGLDV